MTSKYTDSAERFLADADDHQLTVLHDDGLYRHLRFAKPTTGMYWFDLITVPGALIFRGDTDAQFIFARDPDMLTFFRRKSGWNRGDINPQYWAEKITDGRERATTYSVTSFREQVWSSVRDQASEFPGLAKAVQREMGEYDVSSEQGARRMLDEFGYCFLFIAHTCA